MLKSKPWIAILGSHAVNSNGTVSVMTDYVNHAYCAAVEAAGGIPILLPVLIDETEMDPILDRCQGLLIPGGFDVDPKFYNEDPMPQLGTLDTDMDRFWIHAARYALEKGIPVLGICRGMQLVNVAFGGSLYQDLSMMNPQHFLHSQKQNRDYLMHEVQIDEDSRLCELLGTTSIYTNTMHHQCVKEPGEGLRITARTRDGIPEAMETADGQFILVQWHPEELTVSEPRMRSLFYDLVKRAEARLNDR